MRIATRVIVCLALGITALQASAQGTVIESRGEASYRIPLVVSPGPAGHQPDLALVYNSGEGKGAAGWLGFGWSLAGESRIERETRTGTPYDFDNLSCGSTPCYRTAFVLDGQDLVCATSGGCGTPGPTCVYKTQNDDGRKIVYLGETSGWEIYDREGRKLVYGNASNGSSKLSNSANGQVFSWLLEYVDDASGNRLSYTYDKTSSANIAYLQRIDYGQGTTQNRRVDFILNNPSTQDRADKPINVRSGFRQQMDRRVATIEVTASSSLVTRYVLTYSQDPDSTRSRLSAVQRYGANGTSSLPPHLFYYTERSPGAGFKLTAETSFSTANGSCSPGGGLANNGWGQLVQDLVDMNRDGVLDLYRTWSYGNPSQDQTTVNFGTGSQYPVVSGSCSTPGSGSAWSSTTGFPVYDPDFPTDRGLMDVDGDGYPDFVEASNIYRGTGSTFLSPIDTSLELPNGCYLDFWFECAYGALFRHQLLHLNTNLRTHAAMVDMTGDGRPDLVASIADGVYGYDSASEPAAWLAWTGWAVFPNRGVKTSGGSTFLDLGTAGYRWPAAAGTFLGYSGYGIYGTVTISDVNGDGLSDHVNGASVAYGTGAGFGTAESVPIPGSLFGAWIVTPEYTKGGLFDLNADGFVDYVEIIVREGDYYWDVWWGTGSGFRSGLAPFDAPFQPGGGSNANYAIESDFTEVPSASLRDVNGDGLPDRVASGNFPFLNEGPVDAQGVSEAPRYGLLKKAVDPMGGTVEFRYKTPQQYLGTNGFTASPDMAVSRPVVSKVVRSDGRTGTLAITTDYAYAGGVFDFAEKEFRGFATVTASTPASGQPTRAVASEYETDRTCAFQLGAQEVRSGTTVLARESMYFTASVTGGGSGASQWGKCLPSERFVESVEGSESTKKVARTTWEYASPVDPYNISKMTEWGEWNLATQTNVAGDERVTFYTYAIASPGWPQVKSRVKDKRVEDLAGNVYSKERYCYIGACTVASSGRLLKVQSYLTDYTALPTPIVDSLRTLSNIEYDAYGNPTAVVGAITTDDPNGLRTTIAYDSTYATFPISSSVGADTSSPLTTGIAYTGCATGSVAPPGLGLACVVTEPQLHGTVFGYDTFGRITRIERRGTDTSVVSTETRSYALPTGGSPGETTLVTQRTVSGGSPIVVTSKVDGLGRTYYEESPGKISQLIKVARTFDARGDLATETLPYTGASGLVQTILRDVLGRPTAILDPDSASGGLQRTYSYGPWSVTDDAYFGTAIAANRKERTIRVSDGLGRLVEVAQYEDAVSAATPYLVRAKYDPADRLYEVRDPMANNSALCTGMGSACATQDHVTEVTWDTLGRRVKIDDPDSGTWIYRYDDAGLLKERTQHPGLGSVRTQAFTYDHFQRLTQKTLTPTSAGLSNATFTYQNNSGSPEFGHLVGVDTSDTDYVYGYDAAGRRDAVIQKTSGKEFGSVWTFDELDRVKSRLFPDGETFNYTYDGLRLLNIQAAAANPAFTGKVLASSDYDAFGRSTWVAIGEGAGGAAIARMSYGYSPTNARLTSVDGVPGNLLANDPDGDGLIASTPDRCLNAYDPSNADGGGIGASSSADGIGNACQCGDVNASGRVTSDDASAILAFLFAQGSLVKPELCDVTGDGVCELADYNAVSAAASSGSGNLQNCPAALASNVPSSATMSLAVAFDGLGRLTSQSGYVGDGSVNRSFTYDSLSRLKTSVGPWEKATGESSAVTWTYTYDALGNLRTQSSNRSATWLADNRTWSYGHATKPRALTYFEQQTKPSESLSYTDGGELYYIDRGPSLPQETLVWNTIGKLRSHLGSSYTYDAFDDLVKTVSTVGATSTTHIKVGDDFEYDYTNGRATKHFSVNGIRIASLGTVYIAPNAAIPPALRPVLRFAEPLVAPAAATLFGLGLISLLLVATRRRTPGWLAAPGVGVLAIALVGFPYSAFAATLPTGGPGTLGRVNEPFVAYLTDHLGSIRATVNKNGIVIETRDYDPWGGSSGHVGVFAVNHRFTGQPQDEPAGALYNYGARFYSARYGRFLSPDEMVQGFESQGLNPFTYVLNRPTAGIDPTGNFFSMPSFSFGGIGALSTIAAPILAGPSGSDDCGGDACYDAPPEHQSQKDIGGGEFLVGMGTLIVRFPVKAPPLILIGGGLIAGGLIISAASGKKDDAQGTTREGSGRNEPHGDSGRKATKGEKQIKELEKKKEELKGQPGTSNQIKQIDQKIQNIKRAGERAAKGETHHR